MKQDSGANPKMDFRAGLLFGYNGAEGTTREKFHGTPENRLLPAGFARRRRRRDSSPRWKQIVEPTPGHFSHHLERSSPTDVDTEVRAWLEDAWAAASWGPLSPERPVRIPIDGVLDLHTFRPQEIKRLVPDYLEECRRQGVLQVRIIHGKGTGTLRLIVQSLLQKNPHVLSFKTADLGGGGWGATEVILKSAD